MLQFVPPGTGGSAGPFLRAAVRRAARRPYSVLAGVLFAVLAVPFLKKIDSQWDQVYLKASHKLQAGQDLYELLDGYLYPPLMAWLATPFTWLPRTGSRIAWLGLSLLALVLVWRWSWRLSGGGPLQGPAAEVRGWAEHVVCVLGLACGLRYGLDCLQNQQTDLVIAALVLGGCLLLQREKGLAAASCFGLAAGMKCTALLWLPYLAFRGRWRAGLWVAVVAVGLNLLPNLMSRPESGGTWLGEYVSRYLVQMTRPQHNPGVWGSSVTLNQSLSGAGYRFLATDWAWRPSGVDVTERSGGVGPQTLKLIVYGLEAVLVLAVAGCMGCPGRWLQPGDGPVLAERQVLEWSCVLLLMVLLSPMSSKPHFATLLLPAFLLARRAVLGGDRLAGVLLAAATLAGALTIKDLAGPRVATVAMWYGGVTLSTLLLLIGCAVCLRRPLVRPAPPVLATASSAAS